MIQSDPVIDPLPVHGRRLIPVHRSPEDDRGIRPARFVNRTERTDVIYILPYVDRCQDDQGQQDFQNDMPALFITFLHFLLSDPSVRLLPVVRHPPALRQFHMREYRSK